MLEHVALGQSRFMTPGVAPDPRGVVLGRFGLLVFPTIEGVVSWFRLYSAESSLDELLAGMAISRARTPLRTSEMLIRIPATSSYTLDRAGRCAKLVGGATYTGTSKHFVKYRDDRSPYGYDATEIQALPARADLMVHGDDFVQSYQIEGDLAFDRMLFRLSLRRLPGGERLRDDERRELVLVVARGLARGIIRYLWRNRVSADLGLVAPRGRSAFAEPGADPSYVLMQVREVPARILELFVTTPGIDVFRSVAPNVAVQVGYRHVIDLSACASVFEGDTYYVFWGGEDRVDRIDGPLQLSGIEHLTSLDIDLQTEPSAVEFVVEDVDPIGVELKLAPSVAPPRHVIGCLIPPERIGWLKRLLYVLPQTTIRGHRIAVTERGVLLLASEEVDVVPLGQPLAEIAPGLLVPLGMDLVPRVAPEVLARTLGHGGGTLTVFPPQGGPFQLSESTLMPFERRSLARIAVAESTALDTRLEPTGDPTVVNDAVGRFALWGFPGISRSRQLPSAQDDES